MIPKIRPIKQKSNVVISVLLHWLLLRPRYRRSK